MKSLFLLLAIFCHLWECDLAFLLKHSIISKGRRYSSPKEISPDRVVALWKEIAHEYTPKDVYLHEGHSIDYLQYRTLSATRERFNNPNITDAAILTSGISGPDDGQTTLEIPLIDFDVAQARIVIDKVINDSPGDRFRKPLLAIGESLVCLILSVS